MMKLSLKTALMLGCIAVPAGAQTLRPSVPQATSTGTAAVQPSATTTPPESTAARPVAVPIDPAATPARPAPIYLPDAGGRLSGIDRARGEPVVPQTAPIRSLAEAVTLAYHTNPQLLAARGQARATDYRLPQARSALGPTLTASGAYTFNRARQEIIPGTYIGAQGWVSTAALVLNQPVFTFGRNAAQIAVADATSQFQRDALRVTEAQVLNDVVTVYVSVLRDAASVTIARENLSLLRRQLDENETRFQVRDLTLTDLDQTRTRVELGQAQLIQAEGQLGVSQKQFLQTVGAPPGELTTPDLLDIRFGSLEAAYSYAEMNSGLIRAAQAREKISRAAVQAAKAESLPRVDVRGTADYGTVSPYTDRLRNTQILGQVVLTQPIIDSGLRRARVGEAREANEADWRLLDSAFRDTRQAIGSAWDQLASSRASLINYRAAIESAKRAYDGALIQQKAGDRSTLDVLDLARDLLTVRNNYNFAVAQEYFARAALLAAAGTLEGPQIVPGIDAYDADEHFERVKRKGDIPLLTPLLAAIDGVTNGDTRRDRPARDAGAQQALEAAVPLPPATAAIVP